MFLIFLLLVPGVFAVLDLCRYLVFRKRFLGPIGARIIELAVVLALPIFFLMMEDNGDILDCCTDNVVFSPEHRLSLYLWIGVCATSFFYCSYSP